MNTALLMKVRLEMIIKMQKTKTLKNVFLKNVLRFLKVSALAQLKTSLKVNIFTQS